jgi:hypothetical protein
MKILFFRGIVMISLHNINKFYNSGTQKFHALKDVHIVFPEKGMVFIVGKSGSGKSTLLNVIGGIDSYDSGELIIDGLNTKNFSRNDFNSYRNSYIGFIFQEFNVIKNLTVFENIALSLQLKNESIKDNYDLIMNTIEVVGLKGKEKRKMNQLSGGERQRVAIARALVKNPKVIIADEPTGNLDKNNRDIVMDILKNLSTNHLVLIVTHDKFLSKKYSNYEITLKDGQIIHNTLENINHSNKEELNKRTNLNLNPIQPSFKTPILLSLKSLKQNLIRFIFIIVFFCISLIFANTTINLYFSNATAQYSRFQTEYNNKYITLSRQQTLYNQTVKTGFFQIDTINYENLIRSFNQDNGETESNNNYQYKIYKTFKNPIAINQNLEGNLDFIHSESIDNIIVIEDLTEFEKDYTIIPVYNTLPNSQMPIRCYITDYVAESLIANNYFNDTVDENWSNYFADKTIQSENLNNKIYIEGIIETNFNDFIDADLDDPNTFASFTDNKAFYNSLFFNSSIYVSAENANQFVSTNNIQYTYDDFIYSALNQNGIFNNIKLTSYGNTLSIIKGKKPEKKTSDDDFEQIAISTGLLEKVFHYTADEIQFDEDGSMDYALLNPETNTAATFTFYGYRRVMANFSCQVVGIIENEDPVIYFCNPNETNMYYNYLKTSFSDYDNSSKNFGGSLTVLISDSEESNISLYQALRENNITIDNLSYIKLQVVNQFINENLILFLGLFFALCVFSILMIFNFVVITIKNSTKDIGIYMSLGMNGFKISFIYLFQIIIVSTISFILSLIGAIIFLNLLDINLSTTASNLINQYYNLDILPIDFQTFKITTSGILISLLIAYIVPILSVIIPLINLSRKRPIDVLKVS